MGSLVLSLDAELGWGFHHRDDLPVDHVRDARRRWVQLCELFDEYRVPATWAVVGHLFLDECESPHEGHPAGARRCARPPGAADDLWFAADLVDRIRDAAVDHDVGSHGFTHVQFQHERMTESFAAREVERGRAAARSHGVDPASFVFPVNELGHLDLLAEHGYECYRGRRPRRPGRARKLAGALTGRGVPPIVSPRVDERGLVDVPASLYLFCFEGTPRTVAERVGGDPVATWARNGLDRLAGAGGEDDLLHLWLHPHNVSTPRDVERLEAVLAHAAALRDRGEIAVETMADVAARIRGREA